MDASHLNSADETARFLSVKEVAAILGVQPSWVYKQVEARKLPFQKFGHYVRFDRADIDAFIARTRVEPLNG